MLLNQILLIDDDADDHYLLDMALKEFDNNINLTYYQDSTDALSNLLSDTPEVFDMIFLDWNMPKIPGKECLILLRQLPPYKNLPIVIYTTSNSQKDREEALGLGATYFLTKPHNLKELYKHLTLIFGANSKKLV